MKTQYERNVEMIHRKQLERNMDLVISFAPRGGTNDDENWTEYQHNPGIGFPTKVPCIINDNGDYEYRRTYRGTQRDY
jgi:hypothetical protein